MATFSKMVFPKRVENKKKVMHNENKFFNSLITAWQSIMVGLEYRLPCTEEERGRQQLLWNPLFVLGLGCMLGKYSRLHWGLSANDPA